MAADSRTARQQLAPDRLPDLTGKIDEMTMFNARVEGLRAEDGKLIFDVDVGGQKSAPWSYKEFPERGDLWGLSIHTSGEERDRIADAISAYGANNSLQKAAMFARAKTQTIDVPTNGSCLRCATPLPAVKVEERTKCAACEAWYTLQEEAGKPFGGRP